MSTSKASRRSLVLGLAVFLIAVTGLGLWLVLPGKKDRTKTEPDMPAVLKLNNAGIGYMELFDYDKAKEAFTKVVEMAPDWLPGKINLAIALLNRQGKVETEAKNLGKAIQAQERNDTELAIEILQGILDEANTNPEIVKNQYDIYAHYCLGVILREKGGDDLAQAVKHFEEVTKRDPQDPSGWVEYGCGLVSLQQFEKALKPLEKALDLAPNSLKIINNLYTTLRHLDVRPDLQARLLKRDDELRTKDAGDASKTVYGKMGHYADVIGGPIHDATAKIGPLPIFKKQESFQVQLAPQARWATAADLGEGPLGDLRRAVRERFGACIVTLDYNGDGKPDLFLLSAVIENGNVRDLLLRNDGDYHFTDVTKEAGLDTPRPSLGCCVGDIDNDGKPDLIITGAGVQKAFRNTGTGTFEDCTSKMGLDKLDSVCLGSLLVDLDQDSDLDLLVGQYAKTIDQTLELLKKDAPSPGAGLIVFLNKGEALPGNGGKDVRGLNIRFERDEETTKQLSIGSKPVVGFAAGDFDKDRDLDLVILGDQSPLYLAINDRLLRYRTQALPPSLLPPGHWNGALVLDANHDQRSDLFIIGPGQKPVLLLNQEPIDTVAAGSLFKAGATNSPPLLQAHVVDTDLDSWPDIVGLSEKHIPTLLHNDGKRLVVEEQALGSAAEWPKGLIALLPVDVDGDCFTDLVVWSETEGLQLRRNLGNGNYGLIVDLTGKRDAGLEMRCNADALGTWIVAQAGSLWTGQELTTLSAGLGHSRQPLILGLGQYPQADVLRLRWPDGILQAELELPACQRHTIPEVRRETISCPILFAWNGNRFEYITDFLGAGALGEYGPDRSIRPPRGGESVKIEGSQLKANDGQYHLKIAQPMDEVTYIDQLQLIAIDHPADLVVFPDERFVDAEPYASQELLALSTSIFPVKAKDHRGNDVTITLRHWDRLMVDDFAHRAWMGYAEDHAVELDFGDRLSKCDPKARLFLCMAGWTDYPYPEAIWAATQAGVTLQGPVLERQGADGKWQRIGETGFPAGLPRMMTYEVTGKLNGPACVIRLRSNMQVYWDQIYLATLEEIVPPVPAAQLSKNDLTKSKVRATSLTVHKASLAAHPCMRTYTPDGKKPLLYDYDHPEAVPVTRLTGRLTRFGDVTELLNEEDDCFVIFGPGEELDVRFDASKLPTLPEGWNRSFVLKTRGYCKDCAPFTALGEHVEPLPFKAMKNYPYGTDQQYPSDQRHQDYVRKYNTRQVGRSK